MLNNIFIFRIFVLTHRKASNKFLLHMIMAAVVKKLFIGMEYFEEALGAFSRNLRGVTEQWRAMVCA